MISADLISDNAEYIIYCQVCPKGLHQAFALLIAIYGSLVPRATVLLLPSYLSRVPHATEADYV